MLLNRFSDFNFFSDAMGKTNALFGESYPKIEEMRRIYFNNIIDDLDLRLSIYKRISSVNNNEELSSMIIELRDRFGSIPKQLNNLLLYCYY